MALLTKQIMINPTEYMSRPQLYNALNNAKFMANNLKKKSDNNNNHLKKTGNLNAKQEKTEQFAQTTSSLNNNDTKINQQLESSDSKNLNTTNKVASSSNYKYSNVENNIYGQDQITHL